MDIDNMSYAEKRDLAKNPNTPLDILRELAKDYDWGIRRYVARNTRAPVNILQYLATDTDYEVRNDVAKHLNSSSKILITLFEYEKIRNKPNRYTIKALYAHANCPEFAKRVIETLYGDKWL